MLNYEGLRQSLGETFINFVPNAAFRAQVLAKSPVLKPILDAYPLGQTPVDSVTDQADEGGDRHGARRRRHVPLRLPVRHEQHAPTSATTSTTPTSTIRPTRWEATT